MLTLRVRFYYQADGAFVCRCTRVNVSQRKGLKMSAYHEGGREGAAEECVCRFVAKYGFDNQKRNLICLVVEDGFIFTERRKGVLKIKAK